MRHEEEKEKKELKGEIKKYKDDDSKWNIHNHMAGANRNKIWKKKKKKKTV